MARVPRRRILHGLAGAAALVALVASIADPGRRVAPAAPVTPVAPAQVPAAAPAVAPVPATCRARRPAADLPPTGRPTVGGVQLPQGTRCGRFWSTDAGTPEAVALARRLAAAFPRTGLWPVIWAWPHEHPGLYFPSGPKSRGEVPASPEPALRRTLESFDNGEPWPGLAAAEPAARPDPFGSGLERSLAGYAPPGDWTLLLVPVPRPADVLYELHPSLTEYYSDAELTAVLRSWEDRFGATVAALTPSTVDLTVGSPPRRAAQARRLAVEQLTLAPDADAVGGPDELARRLRSEDGIPGFPSARHWPLGWPD